MVFNLKFNEKNSSIDVKFEHFQQVTNTYENTYEGSYEVIPKVTAQSLPTKEKYLLKDVTIKEIPFFEVSNLEGGQTIYIGKEL
jgi:hypothetical protein